MPSVYSQLLDGGDATDTPRTDTPNRRLKFGLVTVVSLGLGAAVVLTRQGVPHDEAPSAFEPFHFMHPMDRPAVLAGMEPEEWLTYSYAPDPTGTAPSLVVPKKRIFNYGVDDIDKGPHSEMKADLVISDSMESAESAVSASVGVDGSYGAFSASVSASTARTDSSQIRKYRADKYVWAKEYTAQTKAIFPYKHLTADAKELLLTGTPAQIVSTLGAFYPSQIELGGILRNTITKKMKSSDSKTSFEASVTAAVDTLAASAAASSSFSASFGSSKSTNQLHATFSTQGGDSKIWLKLTSNNFNEIQQQWADSVNEHNMYPISYKLVPLWNLLKPLDAEKGEALQNYTKKIWADDLKRLVTDDADPYAVPRLSVTYGANGAWWKWDDSGSRCRTDARVDQPQPVWRNGKTYYAVGDAFVAGSHNSAYVGRMPMFAGDVVHPNGYNLQWGDDHGYHHPRFWWPKAPYGYDCLASMATSGGYPDSSKYVCLPSDCIVWKQTWSKKWTDAGGYARTDADVFNSFLDDSLFNVVAAKPHGGRTDNAWVVEKINPNCLD